MTDRAETVIKLLHQIIELQATIIKDRDMRTESMARTIKDLQSPLITTYPLQGGLDCGED